MERTNETAHAPVETPKNPDYRARSLRGGETRRDNLARRLATIIDRYPQMSPHALLTMGEIAVVKACSVATVWRRVADGRLRTIRSGHMVRARKADVERMF